MEVAQERTQSISITVHSVGSQCQAACWQDYEASGVEYEDNEGVPQLGGSRERNTLFLQIDWM